MQKVKRIIKYGPIGFGREGDLASLSSWYDSPFVYTDKYNFSGSQSSFAFSHGTTINIYVVRWLSLVPSFWTEWQPMDWIITLFGGTDLLNCCTSQCYLRIYGQPGLWRSSSTFLSRSWMKTVYKTRLNGVEKRSHPFSACCASANIYKVPISYLAYLTRFCKEQIKYNGWKVSCKL